MSKIVELTNSLLDSANKVAGVVDDYTTNQAKLSTQSKQLKLQSDITNELNKIKRSSSYDKWQDDMNGFFERVKNEMTDENSQYYCKNNLQAQMFTSILEQNQVGVNEKVSQMVFTAEKDHAIVDYTNNLELISQQYTGQDYINKANEGAKLLYDSGYITEEQLQKQYDMNYQRAYTDAATKAFNGTVLESIKRGASEDEVISMVMDNLPEMMAIDTAGLPKSFDKEAMNETLKKIFKQDYAAKLADIQNSNASKLSEIVQKMRQQGTEQGKLAVARQGQDAMNNMMGLQLSKSDRDHYSALFELTANGSLKGSGSGSGSGSKAPSDTFANLIKNDPDTGVEMWLNGELDSIYDVGEYLSEHLEYEWYTGNYKENYDKDFDERQKTYNDVYSGVTSTNTLTDALVNKVIERFPTAKNYMDKNFSALINDIQKNPDQYGTATVGRLSTFILDYVKEADKNTTDEDFVEALKTHVNDCYVESIKYLELKDNGKLKKTFDAANPKDIAQAAQLLHDKDYVFTYEGNDIWAPGKKEALEAEGGVVNVLHSAVISTLGLSAEEAKNLTYDYKTTKNGHDKTSVPIFKYGDKAYEVNATKDGKGFTLTEYDVKTDKNGLPVTDYESGREIDGTVGNKKDARTAAKGSAKSTQSAAHNATQSFEEKRNSEINSKITSTESIPKAMQASKAVKAEEWNNSSDLTSKQIYLQDTENAINNDAKKVKKTIADEKGKLKDKDKMTPQQFYEKYGIWYADWEKTSERSARYSLILDSK